MSKPIIKAQSEVVAYLNRCSKYVGAHAAMTFDQNTFCEFTDLCIESPIEQLFYVAAKTVAELNYIPHHDVLELNGQQAVFGLNIRPQFQIDRYRVDFCITWSGYPTRPLGSPRCVVVECDSQVWHERTEKERRYEKRRDRDLVRRGYHVFRFTGKEIMKHPGKVAIEVLGYVTNDACLDMGEFLFDVDEG